MSATKTCIKCLVEKPESEFYRRSDGKLRGTCKACWRVATRAYQQTHRERFREYQRTHAQKLGRRARALRDKFGMTLAEWEAIWEAQGRSCAICDGRSGDETLHGDHCHESGDFRGILCGLCNRMLGQGQDDADRLRAGAAYLDAHQNRTLVAI